MSDALITPDFDTYPVDHQLVEATTFPGGVEITWDDGLVNQIPNIWLREFSPDLGTFHPETREQMISLVDIPTDLSVGTMSIKSGSLMIEWLPEKLRSEYHLGWLRSHVDPQPELPERALWTSVFQPRWFNGPSILEDLDGQMTCEWAESLHQDGVALISDLPVEQEVLEKIVTRVGPVRSSNFGHIFEVVNIPSYGSNAYTAIRLEGHTDLSTREYMPGLQFLFCIKNGATGGESILVDGFSVAEQLKAESPEMYELLSTVPIPFGTKSAVTDHRHSAPVLEHDHFGQLTSMRYTYWLRTPMSGDFKQLSDFYAAFRRLQELANSPENQISFRLEPGQMMAFDNRRVLHGRDAFDPESGERYLIGCYAEREELESYLRVQYRNSRAAVQAKSNA